MMRDPRYWRDRDPSFVAEVTEGFRRLYAASGTGGEANMAPSSAAVDLDGEIPF